MTSKSYPRIIANFVTDDNGNPTYREIDNKNHYLISFEVENAPANCYEATFVLDPSYYDPRQTRRPDSDGKFRLKTTTYGDYDVKVLLRTRDGNDQTILANLTMALRTSMRNDTDRSTFANALTYIATH